MSLWSAQSGDTLIQRHIAIDRPMNTKPELSLVPPSAKNSSPANQDSEQAKPRLSLVPPLPNAGMNFLVGGYSVNFYDGTYEGKTEDGVPHGIGIWVFDNDWIRCRYEGYWLKGGRAGRGVWKANIRGRSCYSYKGNFIGNKKWGYGTLVHSVSETSANPGKWKYRGFFRRDEMDGYGILDERSRGFRSRYAGKFKNNKRHGHGVEIFFNEIGEIQETLVCQFWNDFVTGEITVTRPDGFVFTGNYEQYYQDVHARGFCEGEGVMINSVGTGFCGTFEKNRQVKGVKWRNIAQRHPKMTYVR